MKIMRYVEHCAAFVIATAILALLKCVGVRMTWLWVFCPIWIPAALILAIVAIVIISVLVKELTVEVRHTMKARARAASIDAEAALYSLHRQPGENNENLKRRIAYAKQEERRAGRL